ncbi:MAG: UDP-N-acetylmuramate dehydrogenase [Patescibacteria group bacterium]
MNIQIEEGVALAPLTTMLVGGAARFFVRITGASQISEVVSFARAKNIPLLVLGGGSNVLIPDTGFSGLVMKVECKGISFELDEGNRVRMIVGAGERWDYVVLSAVLERLWGIENLSLVPGTLGGAIVQNIGAYGVEVCDSVLWVEAYDMQTMKTKIFLRSECMFGYRTSIFKTNRNLIVVRAALELGREEKAQTDYEDVKKYFLTQNNNAPSLEDIRCAIIAIRTAKMPAPPLGTAGSFFKNPVVSVDVFESLKKTYPEIKAYVQRDGTIKLSAAWLLDKVCGWRGVRRGNVGVYKKQSLVLVNYGGASAQEILNLAQKMRGSLFQKTGIVLEEEVVIL